MAKVSAHGTVIGTVYFNTTAKRYMSDGVILKNYGMGWKLHGKVKPEITPQQAYEKQVAKVDETKKKYPAYAAYRKMLHDMTGLSKRWKLNAAVEMMPDDPDGVWSEACDSYIPKVYGGHVSADIDEVVKLCGLYKLARDELKDIKVEEHKQRKGKDHD